MSLKSQGPLVGRFYPILDKCLAFERANQRNHTTFPYGQFSNMSAPVYRKLVSATGTVFASSTRVDALYLPLPAVPEHLVGVQKCLKGDGGGGNHSRKNSFPGILVQ